VRPGTARRVGALEGEGEVGGGHDAISARGFLSLYS
jgi:hypothetical protein